MTVSPDLTPSIREWLDDGPTRMPEPVLAAVVAQLPTTQQRGRWSLIPIERTRTWSFAMGGAATIIAVVVAVTVVLLASQAQLTNPASPPPVSGSTSPRVSTSNTPTAGQTLRRGFPAGTGEITVADGSKIISIDLATGDEMTIVHDPEPGVVLESPSWSADGFDLAYIRTVTNHLGDISPPDPAKLGVWTLDTSATRPTPTPVQVSQCGTLDCYGHSPLSWSPDGQLAYTERDQIYVSGDFVHVGRGDLSSSPTWSPNSAIIDFSGYIGGKAGIFSKNIDGFISMKYQEPDFQGDPLLDPAWSLNGLKIAFARVALDDPLQAEIWVMDSSGANAHRVFTMPGCCAQGYGGPAWSPDGSRLAFVVTDAPVDTTPSLWVMNADGSDAQIVTHVFADRPAWRAPHPSVRPTPTAGDPSLEPPPTTSPTASASPPPLPSGPPYGEGVITLSTNYDEISSFDLSSGDSQTIVDSFFMESPNAFAPSWSPDGTRLAFLKENAFSTPREGNGVWILDTRTDKTTQLSSCPDFDACYGPSGAGGLSSWSTDGTRLAITESGAIDIISADGTERRPPLALQPGDVASGPTWSPDDQRIGFNGKIAGQYGLFVIDADGSGLQLLRTGDTLSDPQLADPAWSPDGTKIAFDRNGFDQQEIWVMNSDGTDASLVFSQPSCCGQTVLGPSWSPDGSRLAFAFLQSATDREWHIYVMNADGSDVVVLPQTTTSRPTWQPHAPQF